jgi:anthranilate synthase component 2
LVLIIDNYDSFTFNHVQLLGELGAEPVVHRNDRITPADIERLAPSHIVISPGPCTPQEAGISVECVRHFAGRIPVLGVCLGHQAIGAAFGGNVVRARRTMHGKRSAIAHTGADLFVGLPDTMQVTRYHSLVVDRPTLPDDLEVIAWTDEPGFDDEIQALRHRRHAVWGVQFHPESIASEGGPELMANFLRMS